LQDWTFEDGCGGQFSAAEIDSGPRAGEHDALSPVLEHHPAMKLPPIAVAFLDQPLSTVRLPRRSAGITPAETR
jgi:hypothetical protein